MTRLSRCGMEGGGCFHGLKALNEGGAQLLTVAALPAPKGCFSQLLHDVRTNAVTVGGVAAGIGGLEVRGCGVGGAG